MRKPDYLFIGVAINQSYGSDKWISMTTSAFPTKKEVINTIEPSDLINWKIVRIKRSKCKKFKEER